MAIDALCGYIAEPDDIKTQRTCRGAQKAPEDGNKCNNGGETRGRWGIQQNDI